MRAEKNDRAFGPLLRRGDISVLYPAVEAARLHRSGGSALRGRDAYKVNRPRFPASGKEPK